MRSASILTAVVAALAACEPPRPAAPAKAPNTELIIGEYERHPPDGETAIRFRADGSVRLARTKALLDTDPPLAAGTWKLDGGRLSLTFDSGMCNDAPSERSGVYTVVISRIGIRFTKVEDDCQRRSAIDGQTWWRIK
jgi:hypothetical protein